MQEFNNVILIDDDPLVNMVNLKLMKTWSFASKIKSYLEPKKALAELKKVLKNNPDQFPDLIFLDLNMPKMDGWEFLKKFQKAAKNRLKKCKVVILSSSINSSDIECSKKHDLVCGFISKPLTLVKLNELCSGME